MYSRSVGINGASMYSRSVGIYLISRQKHPTESINQHNTEPAISNGLNTSKTRKKVSYFYGGFGYERDRL